MIWSYILTAYLSIGVTVAVMTVADDFGREKWWSIALFALACVAFWLPVLAAAGVVLGVRAYIEHRKKVRLLRRLHIMRSGKQCWMPDLHLSRVGDKNRGEVFHGGGWFTLKIRVLTPLSYWKIGEKIVTYEKDGSLAQ